MHCFLTEAAPQAWTRHRSIAMAISFRLARCWRYSRRIEAQVGSNPAAHALSEWPERNSASNRRSPSTEWCLLVAKLALLHQRSEAKRSSCRSASHRERCRRHRRCLNCRQRQASQRPAASSRPTSYSVHDDCRAAHLRETDCAARHVGLELRNPCPSPVFEIS